MDYYHDENFREANFKFHNHRLFQQIGNILFENLIEKARKQ